MGLSAAFMLFMNYGDYIVSYYTVQLWKQPAKLNLFHFNYSKMLYIQTVAHLSHR